MGRLLLFAAAVLGLLATTCHARTMVPARIVNDDEAFSLASLSESREHDKWVEPEFVELGSIDDFLPDAFKKEFGKSSYTLPIGFGLNPNPPLTTEAPIPNIDERWMPDHRQENILPSEPTVAILPAGYDPLLGSPGEAKFPPALDPEEMREPAPQVVPSSEIRSR